MQKLVGVMLAYAVLTAIYALIVKVLVWSVAALGGPVLPFLHVFIGIIALRMLLGRRG